MNTLYKQIPEWENPNNYKEVMIDMNDSNPNTLKVKLEKRFIKIMYKYWSRVRVTSWFYEGMEGTILFTVTPEECEIACMNPVGTYHAITIQKLKEQTLPLPEYSLELIK